MDATPPVSRGPSYTAWMAPPEGLWRSLSGGMSDDEMAPPTWRSAGGAAAGAVLGGAGAVLHMSSSAIKGLVGSISDGISRDALPPLVPPPVCRQKAQLDIGID